MRELEADYCVVGAGYAGMTVGRIHWAGTETSTVHMASVDGAVSSGERVAREVMEAG